MIRINKTKARRLYESGKRIYLLPSKAVIDSNWIEPMAISYHADMPRTFQQVVADFSYYNCCAELGKGVHFYAEL